MGSTLAWLDHSEVQRRRMMEVVSLFSEKDTVDDLGVGSIRDAFSELLFPGTSTLHTRAKYLLFLPWLFQILEQEGVPSHHGRERLKNLEIELIYALLQGGELEGVIGRDAKERLQQFPSFMYWGALRRYGILAAPVTRGQLIDALDGLHTARRRLNRTRDETEERAVPGNWHAGLPPAQEGLLDSTDFALSFDQAGYLTDRIQATAPRSCLAHLVTRDQPTDAESPWSDTALDSAPETTREQVAHARRFSRVIHGAALIYNVALAEAVVAKRSGDAAEGVGPETVDEYRERYAEWAEELRTAGSDLTDWDRVGFWETVTTANPRIPAATQRFVRSWVDHALAGDARRLVGDPDVRAALRRREFETKGRLARLSNPRQLERWNGASGAGMLRYRWGSVRAVVNDIVEGRGAADARA